MVKPDKKPSKEREQEISSESNYVQKKQRAIAAAADVFAEKGFHGATTSDIAHLLGIQQGSLYYYFSSKQEALQQVCEYSLEAYVERMREICAERQSIEEKLQKIVHAHLSNYRSSVNAFKVHNDQRFYLKPARRKQLKKMGSEYRALLETELSRAKITGDICSQLDEHLLAYSIIGLCNAWGTNLVRDGELDLHGVGEHCAHLIWRGMSATSTKT